MSPDHSIDASTQGLVSLRPLPLGLLRLRKSPWLLSFPLGPISQESVQTTPPDQFFNFVLKLNAVLHVVVKIPMIQVVLAHISPGQMRS